MSSLVTCYCRQCNNELKRMPHRVQGKKYGVFCDIHCLGKFRTAVLTGSLAANFKTGDVRERDYIMAYVPWHPHKTSKNKVYLHRLIIEAKLGRYLRDNEVVHHKDENPENNHWENLEVLTRAEHAMEHLNNKTVERDELSGRFKKGVTNE